jgi:hypothetical protein
MSVGITLCDHVTLIVRDGKIADIQGGMSAAKLRGKIVMDKGVLKI